MPKTFAMTGEITLRGRVLPIGGLREKAMAAYRNHATTIIIPEDNRKDLEEVDPVVKENVSFVLVKHMDQVLDTVFDLHRPQLQEEEPKPSPIVIPANTGKPSATRIRQ